MKKAGKVLIWFFGVLIGLYFILLALVEINQERIINLLKAQLKESVQGEIAVGKIHFTLFYNLPDASLEISDFAFKGPQNEIYNKEFLKVKKVFISIQIYKLLQNEINLKKLSLEDAEVFIFKTKSGFSNIDIFKSKADSSLVQTENIDPLLFHLESIKINNTKIIYSDSLEGKFIGLTLVKTSNEVHSKGNSIGIHLSGNINFLGLTFKEENGTFLKNKNTQVDLNLRYLSDKRWIEVDSSSVELQTGIVGIKGLLKLGKPLWHSLQFWSNSIAAQEGIGVLAENIKVKLNRFNLNGLVSTQVSIEGYSLPGIQPKVKIEFACKDAAAITNKQVALEHINLKGLFTNHQDDSIATGAENTNLKITVLKAELHGIPIQAAINVRNFIDPDLSISFHLKGKLDGFNKHLDSSNFYIKQGQVESNFTYEGKLKEYESESVYTLRGKLKGVFKIKDGLLYWARKDLDISKINCDIQFNEKEFNLHSLAFLMGKDGIQIKGKIVDFIPFFTEPKSKAFISLNIVADKINLENFIRRQKSKKSASEKLKSKKRLYELLKKMNEKLSYQISIQANWVQKGTFLAKNLKAKLVLEKDKIALKTVAMQFAKGTFKLQAEIAQLDKDWSPVWVKANFNKVNIQEFLKAFNSFGMKTLTHENISGKLSLLVNLNSKINHQLNPVNQFLRGDSKLKIYDGKLINFAPIMDHGDLVFTKRDFKNIEFAEIQAHLKTSGTESEIDRAEISTNVIRFFVEGRHSLKDSTNILVQVPLANLKKHTKNLKPENIGLDAKMGASVFLRIKQDASGKLKINYVPFPKKKKD
ncbi:MAG: AsmA family protein [Bacteroidia bacterium]|nr:AsmA family protein [Bacteroidia bacterium]MCF8425920.1 AsmA family protein [Bacteroidia bacterium]